MFNLALGESGVNARGIGGFPLKSEFAKETEKERERRDAPLVMIRGLTKRALQPRWSNGVTFGIITTEDEEGSKSSVADVVVLVWRSGRDSLFISRLFNRNLNS